MRNCAAFLVHNVSAALVDALEMYFKQYPHMMKGYIADALTAFKGEK